VISAGCGTFRETHTDSDIKDESVVSHTSEYVISHMQDMTAKVGDFGMARDFSRNKRMAVGREICTLWYEMYSYIRIIYFHTCMYPHLEYIYTSDTCEFQIQCASMSASVVSMFVYIYYTNSCMHIH